MFPSGSLTLAFVAALLAASAAIEASPLNKRDIVEPLPENAEPKAIKFQPGNFNPGLQAQYTGINENCRKVNRLDNSNVYSRQRCNNGICAIMYEYYFEKDVYRKDDPIGGHRHDWENVVVFLEGDQVKMVTSSCHGDYSGKTETPRLHEGTHPKVVYHKDGGSTHCVRMANPEDDAIENDKNTWLRSPLVGWNGWPSKDLRDAMGSHWKGGVGPKLDDIADDNDQTFNEQLNKAQGDFVTNAKRFPQFDPRLDA